MRIRQTTGAPRPAQVLLLVCLYIAALDSKEMAVTLPLLICLYELIYHAGESWRPRSATIGVMCLVTAAYIFGTTRGDESLLNVQGYKPAVSAASYLLQTQSSLNDLIYSADWFNGGRTVALLTALFAVAWLSRNRDLKFSCLFLTIGVLPIAFIAPRGLYAAYIPIVGLAIFLAVLLVNATRFLKHTLGDRPGGAVRVGLFALAALTLAVIHTRKGQANVTVITTEQQHIQDVIAQLTLLHHEIPKGSRILFLKDPFEGRVWDSTFLLRLVYRDNSLVVERQESGKDPGQYDDIWTFENGKLVEVKQ
jgi:hypothetical protein